ncbi:MAG: hypothetical protein ABIG64_01720 [Candidatus Omnitrophota bacterium]
MGLNTFFKFFAALLIIAILIFGFIYSGHEYECTLPNGGHFKIVWNKDKQKIELLHWQPKGKAKPLPKNIIYLESDKEINEKD